MERNRLFNRGREYSKEDERLEWKNARLTNDEFSWGNDRGIYAAKLSLRDNPEVNFYSFIRRHNDEMPFADIPLKDPRGTKANLVEEFYLSTTFMGDIDDAKFEKLATDQYKIDDIMTYLNQTIAGASSDEALNWFYGALDVEHLGRNRDVFIGSHGGTGSFSATIELDHRKWFGESLDLAAFAEKVNAAYPHLELEPLAKNDYFNAIKAALPFLPKDWDV